MYYGYDQVYLMVNAKFKKTSERKDVLKSIRSLCNECPFNIMYDLKEVLEVSKNLKVFLLYLNVSSKLGQFGINPSYSLRSIKNISVNNLLSYNEMNDLCNSISSITIQLHNKCQALLEKILGTKIPKIYRLTKSIDALELYKQILINCNVKTFYQDDFEHLTDKIVESLHTLKSLEEQTLILNIFKSIIIFTNNFEESRKCHWLSFWSKGYTIGEFVLEIAYASQSTNLVELNNFVLPNFLKAFNSLDNCDCLRKAITSCRTNQFVEAFNYRRKTGDFKAHFKENIEDELDTGSRNIWYELIITSY